MLMYQGLQAGDTDAMISLSCLCNFQEMSVELGLEDVKKVALHYGFQLEVMSNCIN